MPILPDESSKEYNQLLRDVYFVKSNDFELSGRHLCHFCSPQVFIKQQSGSGLSALVRHVKAHHEDHREVMPLSMHVICVIGF
jgi:hypothetical protein